MKTITKEDRRYLAKIVPGLRHKIGPENVVSVARIHEALTNKGTYVGMTKLKNLMAYIQTENLIPGLVHIRGGYYVSKDWKIINNLLRDLTEDLGKLQDRINSVRAYRDTLEYPKKKTDE